MKNIVLEISTDNSKNEKFYMSFIYELYETSVIIGFCILKILVLMLDFNVSYVYICILHYSFLLLVFFNIAQHTRYATGYRHVRNFVVQAKPSAKSEKSRTDGKNKKQTTKMCKCAIK